MAAFGTFWYGFLAFFIFVTVGIVLTLFVGGILLDSVYEEGVKLPHGDEATYQQMQAPLPWFMNMFYFVGIGSSVIGALIFGQSIVKRVRVSQYEYR